MLEDEWKTNESVCLLSLNLLEMIQVKIHFRSSDALHQHKLKLIRFQSSPFPLPKMNALWNCMLPTRFAWFWRAHPTTIYLFYALNIYWALLRKCIERTSGGKTQLKIEKHKKSFDELEQRPSITECDFGSSHFFLASRFTSKKSSIFSLFLINSPRGTKRLLLKYQKWVFVIYSNIYRTQHRIAQYTRIVMCSP